jgi:hypothetical protein
MHFYTLHAILHPKTADDAMSPMLDCATVLYKHNVKDTVVWLTEGNSVCVYALTYRNQPDTPLVNCVDNLQ